MENGDLVEKALELGTTYFKNEDYTNANKLFTKAIHLACSYRESDVEELRLSYGLPKRSLHDSSKTIHPRLVRLLDNRAASWEKLGALKNALKDAKRMILEEPYNLKGYIRCGKVLQKLQQDEKAIENYEQGLRMAKDGYEKFRMKAIPKFVDIIKFQERLIRSRKEAKERHARAHTTKRKLIDPEKRAPAPQKHAKKDEQKYFDIIGNGPIEIVAAILSSFDSKQLSSYMLVSKLWHYRVSVLAQLFQNFDLSVSSYKRILIFQLFINKIFSGPKDSVIESLKFSPSTSVAEEKSLSALLQMSNLSFRSLNIQSKVCDFEQLVSHFLKNTKLSKNLEELALVCNYKKTLSNSTELAFLQQAKNLRRLEVMFPHSAPQSSKFPGLRVNPAKIETHTFEKLESLKIICDLKNVSPFFPFKGALLVNQRYQNLSKLFICGVSFDTTMGFNWLIHFPNLRELWFENNKNAFLEDFFLVLVYSPVFKCLNKLTFREHRIGTQPVNFQQYPNLIENPNLFGNLRHLRCLDLMGSSIGGRGLLSIISCIPNNVIRSLNVGDCPYIHYQRSTDNGYLNLGFLLPKIPHVEELFFQQSVAFDDYAVQLLKQNIKYTKKLKKLDLSFNMSITGASIYDLLKELKETEYIVLEKFVIDACPSISEQTVNVIKRNGFAKELSCSYEKITWRSFGINTLVYSS